MQTQQLSIEFITSSPINIEKLSGQNGRLYEYLLTGKRINCMSPAMTSLRIGYLNSRISDLINKFKISIQSQYIPVEWSGEVTTVKEYWIETR